VPVKITSHFEITAYSKDGDALSLDSDPQRPEVIQSSDIRESIKLATDSRNGWRHWDDGESEMIPVAWTMLRHIEERKGPRGGVTYSVHELERFDHDV